MSNTQPYTVMTVCTGNICRSPMGEIILRHFFNERGLGDQVNVESCPSRSPAAKIRSIWWTRGTAASTSSRSPSTRLRKSPRTSSIGWRSSCRNRPVADAVCFAVLRLRVSTSVTASRCRLPRQRKVQKITSLCKGGAEHSEAEGETNESGASEHQLHQQHIYNCAAGD